MSDKEPRLPSFSDLALSEPVMRALERAGYENPSPIQAQVIPLMLRGHDVLGQAHTGTGKTAAFALPMLSRIKINQKKPQVLVLAPTRELAIQVAEAFQSYASGIKGFHVLPIYGGQDYGGQITALRRGVHVVVGTPGRVMDHMRRGTLELNELSCLVLDEADEMLRMGFIDDVEWILEQTPATRQIALFSATIPTVIRKIAQRYLNNPREVVIKTRTSTVETIRQRYWLVQGLHKLEVLTRLLEAEPFEAMLIFVRTKIATTELAEKLEARGYATAALNGDIIQQQRERTIDQLKKGKIDILVATDVAARGLHVERISHVINYDIPHDPEAYVHRIGRTGRAGRKGDAILFVVPREQRLLNAIERATRSKIELLRLPSTEDINNRRVSKFKQRITDTLAGEDLEFFNQIIEQYQQEHDIPAVNIAAALAKQVQGNTPLLLAKAEKQRVGTRPDKSRSDKAHSGQSRPEKSYSEKLRVAHSRDEASRDRKRPDREPKPEMERYRIEVGRNHGVKPGNIVGAILNEAGLDSESIGHIDIHETHSLIDLPEGMPKDIFRDLKKIWVCGQQLMISRRGESKPKTSRSAASLPGKRGSKSKSAHPADKSRPDKHMKKPAFKKKKRDSNAKFRGHHT